MPSGQGGAAILQGLDWESVRPFRRQYDLGASFMPGDELEYRLEGGGFVDYQNDDMGFRLCSVKLQAVIEEIRSEADTIEWPPVRVIGPEEEVRLYRIMHFRDPPDLLDRARTEILGGTIGRMVIDSEKARGHSIMPSPDGSSFSFVVTAPARERLASSSCTGLEFRPVRTS